MALQLRLNGELTGPGENACPRRAVRRDDRPPSSGRAFLAARGRDRKRYFLRSLACRRRISSRRRAASSGAGR